MRHSVRTALLALLLALTQLFASPADARPLGLGFGHHRTAVTGGGAVGPAIIFDNRFGTATDAGGWATLLLHSGNRAVWLNPAGSDANNCLTAATSCATWDHAWSVFRAGTAGDHLMVAEGGTYTDSGDAGGSNSWTFFGYGTTTLAASHPTAVMSYDPADPTNTAKYGHATGPAMPILNIPASGGNTPSLMVFGDSGTQGYAIQGLEIAGHNQIAFNGNHDGILIQNTRWNQSSLSILNNDTVNGSGIHVATANAVRLNISKSSMWGAWSPSGSDCIYIEGVNGLQMQDDVLVHCGWKLDAHRDDLNALGGANVFSHADYIHAESQVKIDRVVYVDSAADGFNARGSVDATQIVSLDEPIAGAVGGYSESYQEAPAGQTEHVDDWMIGGGASINFMNPRASAFNNNSTIAGSYVRNAALFDNPFYGLQNNVYFGGNNINPNITQALLLDKIHGYNYSPQLLADTWSPTNPASITWTNSVIDTAITGLDTINGGGNSVSNGTTFASYKTRAQVYSAMGFTADTIVGKAGLVNAMLWRPDLPWAQALIGVGFPSMGLTPYYPTAPPPSMAGITPRAVYSTDTTAPTLSSPTASATSSTAATLGVTTNEATGRLYWIVSAANTAPNSYQLGQGLNSSGAAAVASGYQSVTATGAQSVSVTGLSASTTYYGFLLHQDLATNRSAIASTASFTTSSGGGGFGGAASTLTDNFNDNSRDVSKWTVGPFKGAATAGAATVAETNTRLEISPPNNSGTGYTGYTSLNTYDLTNSAVYTKVTYSTSGLSGTDVVEAYLMVGGDANNAYGIVNSAGTIFLRQIKAGAESNVGGSFAETSVAWWRLRYDGTTVFVDTAPSTASNPPVSGDWTNRLSATADVAIPLNNGHIGIGGGLFIQISAPPTIYFDGLNTGL